MKALLIAGGVALLVAILGTPLLISQLRARGIGQQIREDGPAGHFSKAGTPTMGGWPLWGRRWPGTSSLTFQPPLPPAAWSGCSPFVAPPLSVSWTTG